MTNLLVSVDDRAAYIRIVERELPRPSMLWRGLP
jgi:hypothetical protein